MEITDGVKSKLLMVAQAITIAGAIYGVYADASKNLDAAKTARDKQISELTIAINVNKEEITTLKRENEHLRVWLRSIADSYTKDQDRDENRFGRIETVLMNKK